MQVVRCNYCGKWIGPETELITIVDLDGDDREICPKCDHFNGLMDVDKGCNFDKQELRELWRLFGDIPINDQDQTEEEFLGFEAGNDRFNIWHWFDERYEGGVIRLIDDVDEEDERSRKKNEHKS